MAGGKTQETAGTIIYVVTAGEYSDYRICAVFSTREKAEAYAAEYSKAKTYLREADVEEWPLDALEETVAVTCWEVSCFFADGRLYPYRGDHAKPLMKLLRRGQRSSVEIAFGDRATAISTVSAEHAVKLATEARQAWLREQTEQPGGGDHADTLGGRGAAL